MSKMSDDFKAAAALAEEIEKLDSKRAALRKQLSQIVGEEAAKKLSQTFQSTGPVDLNDDYGNKTRQILACLKANRGTPMDGGEVAKLIGAADSNNVRTIMHRLAKRGKLKQTSRGHFVFP